MDSGCLFVCLGCCVLYGMYRLCMIVLVCWVDVDVDVDVVSFRAVMMGMRYEENFGYAVIFFLLCFVFVYGIGGDEALGSFI